MLANKIAPGFRSHVFTAVAFSRSISFKELAAFVPELELRSRSREVHLPLLVGGEIRARTKPVAPSVGAMREMRIPLASVEEIFIYPFGVAVFRNIPREIREAWIRRLEGLPHLEQAREGEEFLVQEEDGAAPKIANGVLTVDFLSPQWVAIVAQTMAQSTAMEHYESLVDDLFSRTGTIVARLRKKGSVSMHVRPFHRFIGEAVATRNNVLSNLHLLDKPDAVWDDPSMDRAYADLRNEFDLADRYHTLESKLNGIQEALELILDVARERRVEFLEVAVLLLIVMGLLLSLFGHH